jgi:hypothetical protein
LGQRLSVLMQELPHSFQSADPVSLLEAEPDAGVQAVEHVAELIAACLRDVGGVGLRGRADAAGGVVPAGPRS